MLTRPDATTPAEATAPVDRLYLDGMLAGLIGAATIAVWFLVLDTIGGHPLRTPSLLGAALYRRGEFLAAGGQVPFSFEMVLGYTWVHTLAFCVLGVAASRLLGVAEREPNAGFGILLLFVVLMGGFLVVAMVAVEPLLRALTLPAILIGNLLAAGTMAAYLRHRHPTLTILP
jgi:hypothetical protein